MCDNAVYMHKRKELRAKIKGDSFEGAMKTDGRYKCLSSFVGKVYGAEIDTNHGKRNLSFLLIDYGNPELN